MGVTVIKKQEKIQHHSKSNTPKSGNIVDNIHDMYNNYIYTDRLFLGKKKIKLTLNLFTINITLKKPRYTLNTCTLKNKKT